MTDTAEITLYFHTETDKAILVGEGYLANDSGHVWLPKSQISYAFTGLDHGTRQVTIEAPEWLLIKNGLEHLA